ncbi:DUF4236 domain-containing protein [Actinomycetospora sp. CA-053990]|uniref:DUF4236 domain-containing protein n=1 Tax=Actinomycetospora sp. CA-053990 TaxID=3239891 RepID=UPI003D918BAD
MGFSYRKRKKLGPLPIWINVSRSKKGWSHSWTLKAGPFSHNTRRNTTTTDLPGGWKHTHRHGPPAQRQQPRRSHRNTQNLLQEKYDRRADAAQSQAQEHEAQQFLYSYRPSPWPWAIWAALFAMAVLGGVAWSGAIFMIVIGTIIGLVQWSKYHRAQMQINAVQPALRAVPPHMDPAEAERVVRNWTPPQGWEKNS